MNGLVMIAGAVLCLCLASQLVVGKDLFGDDPVDLDEAKAAAGWGDPLPIEDVRPGTKGEALSVDGVSLDTIPEQFHTVLLRWVLTVQATDGDMNGHLACTTASCLASIEEYERWRQENDFGKSAIRW